jgi:hypothetical protein
MNKHALQHEHASRFGAPVRLRIAELAKMRAQLHDPVRIDAGDGAGKQLRSLHYLASHDPRRLTAFFRGCRRAVLSRLLTPFIQI